jgi:hypothetical protein
MKCGLDEVSCITGGRIWRGDDRQPILGSHATDEYQIIVRGELGHRFPMAFEA